MNNKLSLPETNSTTVAYYMLSDAQITNKEIISYFSHFW